MERPIRHDGVSGVCRKRSWRRVDGDVELRSQRKQNLADRGRSRSEPRTGAFNTCAVFNPSGNLVAKHRKVHLFDIDVPGKITFKESDTLTGGDGITVFDTPFGRVGVGICYDIRFPELAQLMRERVQSFLLIQVCWCLSINALNCPATTNYSTAALLGTMRERSILTADQLIGFSSSKHALWIISHMCSRRRRREI